MWVLGTVFKVREFGATRKALNRALVDHQAFNSTVQMKTTVIKVTRILKKNP